MKVELECICDEINSRHCQYHQDLADLRYEIDEKDKEIERLQKAVAELMPQVQKLVDVLKQVENNQCYDCACGNRADEALTEWREYGGKE